MKKDNLVIVALPSIASLYMIPIAVLSVLFSEYAFTGLCTVNGLVLAFIVGMSLFVLFNVFLSTWVQRYIYTHNKAPYPFSVVDIDEIKRGTIDEDSSSKNDPPDDLAAA